MIRSLLNEKNAQFFVMYASSKNANFRYATKFWMPDPALYVAGADGTEMLVVSGMEKRRVEKESRIKKVMSLDDLGFYEKIREGKSPKDALAEIYVKLLKTHNAKKILVPDDFPAFLYEKLARNFDIEVVENPYAEIRKIKTPEEIEYIRDVSNAIIDAFQFFLKTLKEERDSDVLRNKVEAYLHERGYFAQDTIIAGRPWNAYPHDIGHGRVEGHVIFDIFPSSKKTGYYSDFTRTVIIEEDQEVEDMLKACIEAKNAAISILREGVSGEEIHFKVCDILESHGYKTTRQKAKEGFIHSTGHGVGLEVHEKPRISDGGEELKSGMVITIEPGLYYEKIGGVRVEDTVVVKKSGCEVLTKFKDYVRLGT